MIDRSVGAVRRLADLERYLRKARHAVHDAHYQLLEPGAARLREIRPGVRAAALGPAQHRLAHAIREHDATLNAQNLLHLAVAAPAKPADLVAQRDEACPGLLETTAVADRAERHLVCVAQLRHGLGDPRRRASLALRRQERGGGASGIAVQRPRRVPTGDATEGDLVVDLDDAGAQKSLSLQIKKSVTISGAESNEEFRGIIAAAVATHALESFAKGTDACGFVVEHVTDTTFRSLSQLINWAKSNPDGKDFDSRFAATGTAGADEKRLRQGLLPVIGAVNVDEEVSFYRNFAALHLAGLKEGGSLRAEIINRLQELVAENVDGQDILLFDRLCRIAREGAANAAKWTRSTLLAQLYGSVQLNVAPNFSSDIGRLNAASLDALNDVSETVDDFHVMRDALQEAVAEQLQKHRVVSIGGLPGCGKSAVLKHFAAKAAESGPILFLKNDRLQGTSWTTFATALGLRHIHAADLLAEIAASGTPILFIDGIDRIRPDQQNIITDLIRAINSDPGLKHWKVLASSRDQGLEAYRAWFPPAFYATTGMGNVSVNGFSEEEAERLAESKPNLRNLLFSPSPAVLRIARRPFFAAVLAKALPDDADPQTEVDLIDAWWLRAGHDAMPEAVPQRQRALIDIAEQGVRNLGKGIAVRDLKPGTVDHLAALQADHILRFERGGAYVSFTHDIFFEWSFFRLLIDLGDNWPTALSAAGEPPLLGRVVGLLAQDALTETGRWTAGYAKLQSSSLRAQWRREWLTAPPFTHAFENAVDEFTQLVEANDFALCEKLLVWFQAQHTVPSPIILQRAVRLVEGVDPGLLKLLDALIDLGDRRSAALEQDEAFRRVQGSAA